MSQIHIWPNSVRVPHLDLVLFRRRDEPLPKTLQTLARLGLDTRAGNLVLYPGVDAQ